MSGPSSTAPLAYTPGNQAGQDTNYNNLTSLLNTQGTNLLNTATPGYNQLYNSSQTNPFYGAAQAGAGQVAQAGQGVGQSQIASGQQLGGLASLAPYFATQGATQGGAAGNQILNTGFDPQGALYTQQYGQMQDQQNAINAMNGVAGSPFAAGVTGQAGQNFNTSWLNNQLGRESTALGAFDSNLGQLSSDYASGVNAGNTAATGASNLENQGLNTLLQTSADPSAAYNANQDQILNMLNALVSGDNSALSPTTQGIDAAGQYLDIGQQATGLQDSATQINNQQSQAFWKGLTSLLGSGLGAATGGAAGGLGGFGGLLSMLGGGSSASSTGTGSNGQLSPFLYGA
jgi:hypothetical protein